MDYSITFARHYSRLLWLLLHESGNVDEQKAALRAIVTVSRDGPIAFSTQDYRLVVNGTPLPDALTGVQDLAAQLIGHSVGEVRIKQNAAPADLLGFARILASEPIPGGGTAALKEQLLALAPKTINVVLRPIAPIAAPALPVAPSANRPSGQSRGNGEPPSQNRRPPGTGTEPPSLNRRPPGTGTEPPSLSRRSSGAAAEPPSLSRRSSGAVAEHPSRPRRSSGASATPGRREAPSAPRMPPGTVADSFVRGIVSDEISGRYLAFAAVQAPRGSAAESFARVDATASPAIVTRILDELVTMVDNAGREARAEVVVEVMHGILQREESATQIDRKRAFSMALRRLNKPTLLRLVAMRLPRDRDRAADLLAVLARAGEDGAEALIEQLTAAQSLSDRRLFFDGLLKLQAGVPALMHMLGDPRWYVVRNAADLLGELQAREAEAPLTEAVRHDDERVRRAAATALARLATPRALQALREALRDTSAQVRSQAAVGLAERKEARQAVTLSRALDAEADEEVQLAILGSLGRIATPDAVQKLVQAAEPDGRIFRKKSTAYRVAAVQALAETKAPDAMAALAALADDKEKEVRDTACRLIDEAKRAK